MSFSSRLVFGALVEAEVVNHGSSGVPIRPLATELSRDVYQASFATAHIRFIGPLRQHSIDNPHDEAPLSER